MTWIGWPEAVFIGLGVIVFLAMVMSATLVVWRYFNPLPENKTKSPPDWAIGPWGRNEVCEGVEVRLNEDGTIDEICADDFHLEQLDDGVYWLNFRVGDDWQHVTLSRHGKHISVKDCLTVQPPPAP